MAEFEHMDGYTRFICALCLWFGPWWSDGESAGRDGVHHYGVAHPDPIALLSET